MTSETKILSSEGNLLTFMRAGDVFLGIRWSLFLLPNSKAINDCA